MKERRQKQGKQRAWKLNEIKEGFDLFFESHSRYPTATEFDQFDYLPSSRTVQRRFGGLIALREELNLKGQKDFTKGSHSTNRAKEINTRAHKLKNEVYKYLVGTFGREFVHREFFFTDDKRTRTDFFIYTKDGNFSIDVFYPANRHSLNDCLNQKMRTYSPDLMLQYPVIFVQMNEDITEEAIASIIKNKKNKLQQNQHLMTYGELKKFCKKQKPRA